MPPSRRSKPPEPSPSDIRIGEDSEQAKSTGPVRVLRPAIWHDVSDAIRRTMQSNRGKDTAPERALRSLAHSAGYRFRKHVRGLPGTPDLVFSARRKAIWLHGCLWHSHPGCRFATVPRTRGHAARLQIADTGLRIRIVHPGRNAELARERPQ
jgi:DNA mismatch endonuclease Vsr